MTTPETTEPVAEPAAAPPSVPVDDLVDALATFRLAKAELAKLKEASTQWEGVRDSARRRIEDRLGDVEEGTVDGRTVVKFPHREVWRVDATKLRAELTDDVLKAQGYLKRSVERRFEVTD